MHTNVIFLRKNITKKKTGILVILLVLFISCNTTTDNKIVTSARDSMQVSVKQDSLLKKTPTQSPAEVFLPEIELAKIDSLVPECTSIKSFLYFKNFPDSIKLQLYVSKSGIPVKLVYTSLDDGGVASGYGAFYFDSTGYAIAKKDYWEDAQIVEFYLGNHDVLQYRRKDGAIEFLKQDKQIGIYREAVATKALDDYMMVLNEFNYTAPNPSRDAGFVLKTEKQISLFETPDEGAKQIGIIDRGKALIYLGNNRRRCEYQGMTWAWYHVVTVDGKDGWVFGHPEFVSDLDDENY